MTKQTTILTLMLVLASPAAFACNPAEGSGQCGYLGADGIYNSRLDADESYQRLYYNNTYVEPGPVYRPPPPPPTHRTLDSPTQPPPPTPCTPRTVL